MSEGLAVGAVAPVGISKATSRWHRDRWFFSGMAIAAAVVVFVGFAPTYYLRSLYATTALPALVHLHGALFSAWIVLLVVQTSLVAMKRTDIHRRLGVAGAALAVAMLVVGYVVAINQGSRSVSIPGPLAPGSLQFTIVPIGGLVVFATLIGAAFVLRRRTAFHKRLMLLGTIDPLNAAVDRLPGVGVSGLAPFYYGTDMFLLALVLYDVVSLRRIHPATLWGGLFLVASQWLRVTVADTTAWIAVATWLTR
jgi:hypothetical protein